MDASMWVAKTGLDAQQTRMNVISNNLANVNTTGFKRDRAVFEDMLYQNVKQAGGQTDANSQAPTGLMLGTGVRIVATEKLHSQGNMITTQNPLDVAIAGDGYFQIAKGDGTLAYTRDGGFKISATGQLVTSSGASALTASGICKGRCSHQAAAAAAPSPRMTRASSSFSRRITAGWASGKRVGTSAPVGALPWAGDHNRAIRIHRKQTPT